MDIDAVRRRFPALRQTDAVYADNAGGTQVLDSVIDHVSTYYTTTNAQLGGLYHVSKSSASSVQGGLEAAALFINSDADEVVFGSSTTQLFVNLSLALEVQEGDEFIVSEMDHEANIAPWHRLALLKHCKVIPWRVRPEMQELDLSDLKELMTPRTRLVTLTHSSNMLGTINPIKEIADFVHSHSDAQIVVDGVAFAPHALIDVKALGIDFYCFSWYKVYAGHTAMLYASKNAQGRLVSLGHYFHTGTDLGTLLGLAGGAYELQSAIACVVKYISSLGSSERVSRASLSSGFDLITKHEEEMQTIILSYLLSKPETFTVWGSKSTSRNDRMPLISFTVKGMPCSRVVARIHEKSKFGIRNGHMYSKRLMDHLGLDEEYAIRISLVHYNSVAEAKEFIATVDHIISAM